MVFLASEHIGLRDLAMICCIYTYISEDRKGTQRAFSCARTTGTNQWLSEMPSRLQCGAGRYIWPDINSRQHLLDSSLTMFTGFNKTWPWALDRLHPPPHTHTHTHICLSLHQSWAEISIGGVFTVGKPLNSCSCRFYLLDSCTRGDACLFAHDVVELREPWAEAFLESIRSPFLVSWW